MSNSGLPNNDAERLIDRLSRQNDLNAIPVWDADVIQSQPVQNGPLSGLSLAIKDNINTADYSTSAGTPALAGNDPGHDAPLVAALRAAGAVIAGKANMHELSSGGTSANHLFGPARNPYGKGLVPGGSSGGSAAAVAAGLTDAAIGTDTAGSVRAPAALCGVIGFKPTTGRYDTSGIVPLSSSFDTPGTIARSMDVIRALDTVLARRPAHAATPTLDASMRLGFDEAMLADLGAAHVALWKRCMQALDAAGIEVIPIDLTEIDALTSAAANGVIDFEFEPLMTRYLARYAPHVTLRMLTDQIASPSVKRFTKARLAKPRRPEAYEELVCPRREALHQAWRALFLRHGINAIVYPTTPKLALPLHEDDDVILSGAPTQSWFYFAHTRLASIALAPAITLPIGVTPAQRPAALELMALPGQDAHLLALAAGVTSYLPAMPEPTGV